MAASFGGTGIFTGDNLLGGATKPAAAGSRYDCATAVLHLKRPFFGFDPSAEDGEVRP